MQDNIHKGTTAIGRRSRSLCRRRNLRSGFQPVTFNYDDMAEWFDVVAFGKKPAIFIPGILTQPFVPLGGKLPCSMAEKMPPVFLPVWLQSATPYFPIKSA